MNRVTTSKQLPAAAADTDKNFALRLSPGLHVEMPSLKLDPAAPLTIELWVTPQSRVTDNKHVFGWPGPISLFIRQEDSCWAFGLSRTGKFQFAKDPQPITPNRRVHLATVRNGKDFQLFVDGQRVASDREHESPLKYAAKPFSLSVPGSNAFTGEYDELRISRIVRYDDTFEPQHRFEPDSDTLALYHCDENGGEQLLDASAHKHHGQIFGKAKWIAVSKAAATDAEQRK